MPSNPSVRTEIIEIIVNNVGVTEFSLGLLPNLRQAKNIMQVEAYKVSQVPLAPSSKTVINDAVFSKSYLKFISTGSEEYRTIPLLTLNKINGTPLPILNVPPIDTEKSKIVVGSSVGLVLNEVFLLAITYEK